MSQEQEYSAEENPDEDVDVAAERRRIADGQEETDVLKILSLTKVLLLSLASFIANFVYFYDSLIIVDTKISYYADGQAFQQCFCSSQHSLGHIMFCQFPYTLFIVYNFIILLSHFILHAFSFPSAFFALYVGTEIVQLLYCLSFSFRFTLHLLSTFLILMNFVYGIIILHFISVVHVSPV